MRLLLKLSFFVIFSISFFSCNLFIAIVDEYVALPEKTIIPEETPTPDTGETPTPASSPVPYEILFNSGSGSGWFGGDDNTPRNVGNGQGIYIDTDITITDFSFYFSPKFDFPYNPEGIGHAVTIRYTLRDNAGNTMMTQDVSVSDTFSGGWISWSNINWSALSGETWIFTAYLLDGYTNMYTSGTSSDTGAGYAGGERYTKTGTTNEDMDSWSGWTTHPWDSWFWLQGIVN